MLSDHLVPLGFNVEVALNGGDAVMIASLERPDAVILDLMLPEVSGEQVFTALRELDDSIAVVLLTGMADETVARNLLRAGAFDYLRKPPDLARLVAAVELAMAAGRDRGRARSFRSDRTAACRRRRTPPIVPMYSARASACIERFTEARSVVRTST